jgi:hypothetical protein
MGLCNSISDADFKAFFYWVIIFLERLYSQQNVENLSFFQLDIRNNLMLIWLLESVQILIFQNFAYL